MTSGLVPGDFRVAGRNQSLYGTGTPGSEPGARASHPVPMPFRPSPILPLACKPPSLRAVSAGGGLGAEIRHRLPRRLVRAVAELCKLLQG